MLRREAARWLARLQGGADPAMKVKFQQWYDRDPRYAEAFDRVRQSYERAGLLRQSPAASAALAASAGQQSTRDFAWAAGIGLVALVAAAVLLSRGLLGAGTEAVMLTTAVGEIREVRLADGTKVTLDTASRVEVDPSKRRASLSRGRARFEIARRKHPFIIVAGATSVIVEAGTIDIEQAGPASRVDVLAGSAEMEGRQGHLVLGPLEGLTDGPDAEPERHAVAGLPDWTRGMLQFDGTPVAEAVERANRYSTRPILIAGDVGELRVTGAFRAGDTAGLAKALSAAFGLRLHSSPDGRLILARPPALAGRQQKEGG